MFFFIFFHFFYKSFKVDFFSVEMAKLGIWGPKKGEKGPSASKKSGLAAWERRFLLICRFLFARFAVSGGDAINVNKRFIAGIADVVDGIGGYIGDFAPAYG